MTNESSAFLSFQPQYGGKKNRGMSIYSCYKEVAKKQKQKKKRELMCFVEILLH